MPATSKAKTPTFDFLLFDITESFGFGTESKLLDIADLTFINQVSRAILSADQYVMNDIDDCKVQKYEEMGSIRNQDLKRNYNE